MTEKVYPIILADDGYIQKGITVETFILSSGVEIPAVVVGEMGRGRKLGVLPVVGAKPEDKITAASIGETRSGRPKLIARREPNTDQAIVVFREPIGFRGSNKFWGDLTREYYTLKSDLRWLADRNGIDLLDPRINFTKEYTEEEARELHEYLNRAMNKTYILYAFFEYHRQFDPFPGKILAEGVVAQGAAGRMGSGRQLVAVLDKGAIVTVTYQGRRYGSPKLRFYFWNGENLVTATQEEREIADLF